jgi:hypothetical protein
MPFLRIEILRDQTWHLRSEGETTTHPELIRLTLAAYNVELPHRALLDGVEVARVVPRMARARGALRMVVS